MVRGKRKEKEKKKKRKEKEKKRKEKKRKEKKRKEKKRKKIPLAQDLYQYREGARWAKKKEPSSLAETAVKGSTQSSGRANIPR